MISLIYCWPMCQVCSCMIVFSPRISNHDFFSLVKSLSQEQLARRRQDIYTFPCNILMHQMRYPSHILAQYQRDYADLMQRLRVDAAILDSNYPRLDHCLQLFGLERIRRFRSQHREVELLRDEYPLAIEFFLQIDGNK